MSKRPAGRSFQFGLRTLLAAVLLLSVLLALFAFRLHRARRQAAAVATIRELEHIVEYEESSVPAWLISMLGPDFFQNVKVVWTREGRPAKSIEDINRFSHAIEQFRSLEEFRSESPWIDGATIEWLGGQSDLRELQLEGTELHDADLAPLQRLKKLELLFIIRSPIGDEGAVYLADFPELRNLCLRSTQIGDNGAAYIAQNTSLRMLQLGETQIGDRGAAEIAKLPALKNLKLDSTKITDDGLAHLARLRHLNWLQLNDTRISDAGLIQLAVLPDLETLEIADTNVTGTAFEAFGPENTLTNLAMDRCPVSDAGIKAIARLPRLKRLMLSSVSDPLPSLEEVTWPPTLEEVYFYKTSLTDKGLARLAACPNLKAVNAEGSKITAEGVRQFQQAHPTVRVRGP